MMESFPTKMPYVPDQGIQAVLQSKILKISKNNIKIICFFLYGFTQIGLNPIDI